VVKTKLVENTLQMMADETGGAYTRATQADFGLRDIYENNIAPLEKKEGEETKTKVYNEKFQYPLTLAFICLLLELLLRGKSEKKKEA